MMTRTDYIDIAAILKAERKAIGASVSPLLTTQARLAIDHITRELADLMAAGNPRFNRATFYAAAGMGQS